MGLSRSVLRHTAIYSVATILGKLVGFIMLPFYAHIFETEGYGVIGMIDTSLGVLMIPLAGGFQAAILRLYHEQQDAAKKPVVLGTGIRLVWGIGFALVALPMVFSMPLSQLVLGSTSYTPLICLALLSFVIDVAGQSASTFLILKERSLLYSVIGLVRLVLGLGLNIWLIVILRVGLIGVFISSLVTAIVAAAAFHFVAIRYHGCGFDRGIARQMLRFQLPLLPGDIVAFCGRQAERVLVRVLVSLEGMGVLEMAYRFPPLLNMLISIPFERAWRTKSMEIAEQPWAPVAMGRMLTQYLFLMVFGGLVLAVCIPQVLMLLTPPDFWPAARIVRLEVLTTILAGCTMFMDFGILYRKQTRQISLVRICLTPVKVLLAFALISQWGLEGAAYSALVIQAVTLIWIGGKGQSLYQIVFERLKLLVVLVAAVGLYLLLGDAHYSKFAPAIYARTELLPEILHFMQETPLGSWKDGRVIDLLQSRAEPFVTLFFNLLFCSGFLALFPLMWQRRPEGEDRLVKSGTVARDEVLR